MVAGYLTRVQHECKIGYWNSLDGQASVEAKCLPTGHWSDLITCSPCSIPARYSNPITQANYRTLGLSANSMTSRIVSRANELINGFAPAYEIELWCSPQSAPIFANRSEAVMPLISKCSQATGNWYPNLQCITCRSINNKRRCVRIKTCSACMYGPWTLPPDLFGISQFVL
jgi:hypothetical protein